MAYNTHLAYGVKGGLKVDEHRERLMELCKQASNYHVLATLMKLSDEKLL